MFFKIEAKFSKKFGDEFIKELISCLESHFDIETIGNEEVEDDLIFYNFMFDSRKITLLSEAPVGTSFIGDRKTYRKMIELLELHKPEFIV